jgi:hypothetical protein
MKKIILLTNLLASIKDRGRKQGSPHTIEKYFECCNNFHHECYFGNQALDDFMKRIKIENLLAESYAHVWR